jgi:hypothetical protein
MVSNISPATRRALGGRATLKGVAHSLDSEAGKPSI